MKQFFTAFLITTLSFISFNGFSQVTVSSSDSVTCADPCTTLTAHVIGDTPTNAGVTEDDIYSPSIPIGFTFSFWGINHTSVVLGANGTLDFNTSDAGGSDPWPITAALAGNPSKYNNICGPWCDIDIFYTGTPIGTETYSTDGIAPFRKFVVTWCGCSMYECPDQLTTTQIILYETTNVIEVHLAKKDICTSWNPSSPAGAGGRAIIGVEAPSSMGGAAVVAPGRDWTPVWSALDEAWRFTPTGGTPASYTVASIPYAPVPYESSAVYWYNATTDTYIGSGDSITVCPLSTTTYKAAALGCADSSFGYYTVVKPPINISVISTTNPTVCGYNDGTVTLTGFLPSTNYTVTFDSASTPMTPFTTTSSATGVITVTGLYAGTYNNFVGTTPGCITTPAGPATLTDPPPPVVSAVDTLKTCIGVPVSLNVNAFPAGITYYYTWSPPVGLSSSTIADPIDVPVSAGNVTYTVTVNPSPAYAHCASTATTVVHTLPVPVLNNHDTVICLGSTVTGSITGSPEMSYSWTPATGVVTTTSMNPAITPTMPCDQTYVFTATYPGCPTYSGSFTIEVDTPAIPRIVRDTVCLGMADSFDLTVPGSNGIGCGYYHYQWNVSPATGVVFSNDTAANPVIATTGINIYTITVTVHPTAATPGCTTNDVVYLDVLPNSVSVNPVDTSICKGAVVQIFGSGDPNFSYQWIPTAGIANSTQLNTLIHPDTTALYTVVASFHRCPDMYATSYIDVEPTPSVFIGGNRFKCVFDTIHITATVSPGYYSSYSYVWTPAAGLDNTTSQTVVYNGAASEWVYVTVNTPVSLTTDSTCRAKDSAYITVYPGPGASITNMSFCPHDSAMLMPTPSTVSYHWYPPLYLSDSMSATPVIHPVTTQVYTVVATTDHGCSDTLSFTATVYPAATILMPDSVDLSPGDSYSIEPITNCVTFNWFPPTGLSSTIISNPVATPAISTKYLVTATTDNGCVVTDSINIIIDESTIVAMPNAFTPGNGVNNVFKVQLKGAGALNYFRVFNRWGNLIYETQNIDEGWDGNFHGQAQPQGVYVYEVQAVTESGKVITKQGNITLLR